MSRASKTKRMEKTWDSGCILYIYWHNRTHYLREKREQTNLKIEQKNERTSVCMAVIATLRQLMWQQRHVQRPYDWESLRRWAGDGELLDDELGTMVPLRRRTGHDWRLSEVRVKSEWKMGVIEMALGLLRFVVG